MSELSRKEILELLVKQWDVAVRVASHFNDMTQRLRQMTVTFTAALYAASITSYPITQSKSVSAIIIMCGWILLFGGWLVDRYYYYRMLEAAVQEASRIENQDGFFCKITCAISVKVSPKNAKRYAKAYYWATAIVGLLLLLTIVFVLK